MERFVTFARDSEIIERFLAVNIDKIQADAEYDFEFKKKIQPTVEQQKPPKSAEPCGHGRRKTKFNNVALKVRKTKKITRVIKEEKDKRQLSGPERLDASDPDAGGEQQQQGKSMDDKARMIEEKVKQFLDNDDDDGLGLSQEKQAEDEQATQAPPQAGGDVIMQEMRRKKKRRRSKYEEMFTDKDRAAAVNLGSKDIKQSLKIKRKMDRSSMLHIPEEAEPATFIALGNYEVAKGSYKIALGFMHKALELNPAEKDALVARSKCYILMGQPDDGLRDAEAALTLDKSCMKAVYQKAEALYYLGDFEHSLMYYHRGLRHRPDHEGFKLGVQKAQKAIENAIGGPIAGASRPISRKTGANASKSSSTTRSNRTDRATADAGAARVEASRSDASSAIGSRAKSTKRSGTKKVGNNRLLRELAPDKEYLNGLLANPDIECKFKENNDDIVNCIKEAVHFLNTREEFWRQQLPAHMKQQ